VDALTRRFTHIDRWDNRRVDKAEARAVGESVLANLRRESYDSLVQRLLDRQETREIIGDSGVTYQIEVQAFWDSGKRKPGNLRVMVNIDDGGLRAFLPTTTDFIIAPDGSFIGE
jgi:hypothetical protein